MGNGLEICLSNENPWRLGDRKKNNDMKRTRNLAAIPLRGSSSPHRMSGKLGGPVFENQTSVAQDARLLGPDIR